MKKILFFVLLTCSANVSAQDVIVKKDGSTIISKVLEVNIADIKYKKFSNQNGPTYTIRKSDVMAINYENGEKDDFRTLDSKDDKNEEYNERNPSQRFIEKKTSENNSKLIEKYRGEIQFSKTASNKDAKYVFPIMAVSDSSLMSNDEIEMRFIPTIVNSGGYGFFFLQHYIEIENKTNRTIYIDLANSFRINTDNTYKNYYDTEQTSVLHGNSSGGAVGLGGIASVLGVGGIAGTLANSVTVGGSSQNTVMTTYSMERIKAIPPHAKANLTEYKDVKIKRGEYKTISDGEEWSVNGQNMRGEVKKDGHKFYNEENTPYTKKYIVTYSTSQDFSTYSMLYAKVYARCIVGSDFGLYFSHHINNKKKEKVIKEIQKYVSNFWIDSYLLVGGCTALSKK
ncbi:MAG: hypothetical protein IJ886_05775 [Prevotella sp.]|nr:hypothetical protein [Prevotella sp.]